MAIVPLLYRGVNNTERNMTLAKILEENRHNFSPK